jgi:hypothetical protein
LHQCARWYGGGRHAGRQFPHHEDFAVNYARAREARADARSDKIDRLIDQMLKGEIKSDVARVAIDALKWQAGREMPKRYGDKIVSEHVGRGGGPIETMEARDKVKDHLEGISKRFAAGLKLIEGDKNVDHLEGLSQR